MGESSVIIYPEKLAEVESHVFIHELMEQPSEVVGIDVHRGQGGVWIRITEMGQIPWSLCPLLHHIIPGINLVLLEVIQQVERSAGKSQYLGICFCQFLHNSLAEFRLCPFVRLVHDDAIPSGGKHLIVLVEVAAHKFRTAQILHGSEIDILAFTLLRSRFKWSMAVTIVLWAVCKTGTVIEYLAEILEPAAIHHRAMCKNQSATEIHTLHHLQCRQRLAKTHLGIPKHLITLLELFLGLFNGFPLFRAEYNRSLVVWNFGGRERFPTFLYGCNCPLDGFKVGDEPLVGLVLGIEYLFPDAGTFQNAMHFLIVERTQALSAVVYRKLRI